jgi:hypothetical protein
MDNERDEANLMGQVAGIIAVMSAVVQSLPPSTRKRLAQQLHPQFESLMEAMCTMGPAEAEPAREGAEWVRDLFLRQIAKANKKRKDRETSCPAGDALDIKL